MKIQDLVGLSKPLTRLIEVVSKGVGTVTEAYFIRKKADSRAYEIQAVATALNHVRQQNQLPVVYNAGEVEIWQRTEDNTLILDSQPINKRTLTRHDYQERKRQNNIESVTTSAAAELLKETEVADAAPDDDWITRFFSCAQDVNSEQMRELWGKILAGEIKKPGSYSVRTLDFVRNLTLAEANLFEAFGKLALNCDTNTSFVVSLDKEWLKNERGILPIHHFQLAGLGTIFPTDLSFTVTMDSNNTQVAFISDNHLLLIDRGQISGQIHIPVWKFTGIGQELLPLIQKPLDEPYLERIGRFFVSRNGQARIAKITQRLPNGQLSIEVIKPIALVTPQS